MSIGSSRATKRPAQGGAGSKRCVLGCDPGAGQESAMDCAFLTRAFTVASPEAGAPAPRSGASPVLAATRRDGAIWTHIVVGRPCNIDILLRAILLNLHPTSPPSHTCLYMK